MSKTPGSPISPESPVPEEPSMPARFDSDSEYLLPDESLAFESPTSAPSPAEATPEPPIPEGTFDDSDLGSEGASDPTIGGGGDGGAGGMGTGSLEASAHDVSSDEAGGDSVLSGRVVDSTVDGGDGTFGRPFFGEGGVFRGTGDGETGAEEGARSEGRLRRFGRSALNFALNAPTRAGQWASATIASMRAMERRDGETDEEFLGRRERRRRIRQVAGVAIGLSVLAFATYKLVNGMSGGVSSPSESMIPTDLTTHIPDIDPSISGAPTADSTSVVAEPTTSWLGDPSVENTAVADPAPEVTPEPTATPTGVHSQDATNGDSGSSVWDRAVDRVGNWWDNLWGKDTDPSLSPEVTPTAEPSQGSEELGGGSAGDESTANPDGAKDDSTLTENPDEDPADVGDSPVFGFGYSEAPENLLKDVASGQLGVDLSDNEAYRLINHLMEQTDGKVFNGVTTEFHGPGNVWIMDAGGETSGLTPEALDAAQDWLDISDKPGLPNAGVVEDVAVGSMDTPDTPDTNVGISLEDVDDSRPVDTSATETLVVHDTPEAVAPSSEPVVSQTTGSGHTPSGVSGTESSAYSMTYTVSPDGVLKNVADRMGVHLTDAQAQRTLDYLVRNVGGNNIFDGAEVRRSYVGGEFVIIGSGGRLTSVAEDAMRRFQRLG